MTAKPLILEVLWGPAQGRKAVVPVGGGAVVGTDKAAALRLDADSGLAPLHFKVLWDGAAATVVALVPQETCLGGQPIIEATAGHGGWVRAGSTDFVLSIERHTPPAEPPTDAVQAAAAPVLAALRGEPGKLYAVLDAARAERIATLLRESPAPYRSLYDGGPGDALLEVAPRLVALGQAPQLLEDLVHEGWERPWGVFLAAPPDRDLEAVRRHLRKFLMVELARDKVYFRFYDPRVFAAFVPTCAPAERRELLGDMAWHVIDFHASRLVTFRA